MMRDADTPTVPGTNSTAAVVRVSTPVFTHTDDRVRVTYPVEGLLAPTLWFEVQAEYHEWLVTSMEAPVAALLAAAMHAEKSIHLEGAISPRFLWHVRNTVNPVVSRQLPFLRPVPIRAAAVAPAVEAVGDAILTGFSCGVDSLSALQDHFESDAYGPDNRVTHLLFAHIGHHGYGAEVDLRAEQRWQRMQRGAAELGLPMLRVTSNTPEFYPPEYNSRLAWAAALTLRNSAVPLLLQSGVRRFLFASSHSWQAVGAFATNDMTLADPILLPALSTERTELAAVGSEYTRVEKTRRIARMPLARTALDVCIMDGHGNCTRCEKCLRTALTLELLGELPAFSARFDLTEYARRRDGFLAHVLAERDYDFLLEIQELIREQRLPMSLGVQGRAALIRAWRSLPRGVRTALRRG